LVRSNDQETVRNRHGTNPHGSRKTLGRGVP
jgi:hypothetical protein